MSKIGLLVLIESVDVNLSNSIGNDFFRLLCGRFFGFHCS